MYKLRKELGEMAISINMESQKQRTLKYDEEKYVFVLTMYLLKTRSYLNFSLVD